MCGEQWLKYPEADDIVGSSPRVRGTACTKDSTAALNRFIPACAGNSPTCRSAHSNPTVHPRVCGEQIRQRPASHINPGSSPRVRGTVCYRRFRGFRQRFIPACAGNSGECDGIVGIESVHPRVCGEQMVFVRTNPDVGGSSPRVRGTALLAGEIVRSYRFIPACAGNRSRIASMSGLSTVHPRVCGEQPSKCHAAPPLSGSSPRVRGTDLDQILFGLERRFIPACAGNRA